MKGLYEEMKKLALLFKNKSDKELGKVDKNDLLRVNNLLKQEEQQDKNLNDDLELQNFYLAIKLNFFRVDE